MKIYSVVAILLLGFVFEPQNANAQVPIIDCNDIISCGPVEPWKEYNYLRFYIDGCIVNPRFRITKCCNGDICKYIVDLYSILTFASTCTKTPEEIRIEAIKFIMSKTPELFNIGYFQDYELHFKQPKCMTNENKSFFMIHYKLSKSCEPDDCCLAVYQLASYPDKVRVINQFPYTNNYVTCVEPGGTGCQFTCNSVDFTPPLDVLYSDYNPAGDPCLADCFWRLDGNNNVTSHNFIGPTNDMPLVLKTGENSIYLAPNNRPCMVVSANPMGRTEFWSKVFIATTKFDVAPDIALAVGAKIIAEEVIVKLEANWPDYVFSDDYDLIPLNQLEARIKERGALPGIPTAEEMQKDANIPLGEMNLKLLQKIEEMTLYLIELEKKNHSLEQRLQKLEGK